MSFKMTSMLLRTPFGELMDAVNLSEVVEFQRFSEGDNTPDSKRFALSSDDYVWEVLSECRNAPFVEDQTWTVGDRSYLSFTITSEALGVYKHIGITVLFQNIGQLIQFCGDFLFCPAPLSSAFAWYGTLPYLFQGQASAAYRVHGLGFAGSPLPC